MAALIGVYVMATNWAIPIAKPIADFSRTLETRLLEQCHLPVCRLHQGYRPTHTGAAGYCARVGIILLQGLKSRAWRIILGILALAVPCALSFTGVPFALVGGAYIIMAAYIVRSLPASVRVGSGCPATDRPLH